MKQILHPQENLAIMYLRKDNLPLKRVSNRYDQSPRQLLLKNKYKLFQIPKLESILAQVNKAFYLEHSKKLSLRRI